MTLANTNTAQTSTNPIIRAGEWLFAALIRMGERSTLAARADLARRLQGMTDEELARLGVARDQIIPFAFRGYIGL